MHVLFDKQNHGARPQTAVPQLFFTKLPTQGTGKIF
jgi:hypothetical protein